MPLRTYSSGMILRLAFAICTAFVPDILLMDELISVGDVNFAAKAEARINAFIDRSRILVFASHDTSVLERYCNRAVILQKGEIVFDGNFNEGLSWYREVGQL